MSDWIDFPANPFWVLRSTDFLLVAFTLRGFRYRIETGEVEAKDASSIITMTFPPQHIAERAFQVIGTDPPKPNFDRPWEAALARASRIDFKPDAARLRYTLEALLRACASGAVPFKVVTEPAARKAAFEPINGAYPGTALELPWGIVLQPQDLRKPSDFKDAFSLPLRPLETAHGGTLLWQARLQREWGVAAVWALDADPFPCAPNTFCHPLPLRQRMDIVEEFGRRAFAAQRTRNLALSSLGATLDIHAVFDTATWTYRIQNGRDQFGKYVKQGCLYPIGLKAAHVEQLQRVVAENGDQPYAYVEKRTYVDVRETRKEQRPPTDFFFNVLDVSRFPRRTPPINPREYPGEVVVDDGGGKWARLIRIRDSHHRFPVDATDVDGRQPVETAALQLFVTDDALADSGTMTKVQAAYKAIRPSVRAWSFGGERMAIVSASQAGQTASLPIWQVVVEPPAAMDVRAEIKRALAHVPQLDVLRAAEAQVVPLRELVKGLWGTVIQKFRELQEHVRMAALVLERDAVALSVRAQTWKKDAIAWIDDHATDRIQGARDRACALLDRCVSLRNDIVQAPLPPEIRAQLVKTLKEWEAALPKPVPNFVDADVTTIERALRPALDALKAQVDSTKALLNLGPRWDEVLNKLDDLEKKLRPKYASLADDVLRAQNYVQRQRADIIARLDIVKGKLPEVPAWALELTAPAVLEKITKARGQVQAVIDAGESLVNHARNTIQNQLLSVVGQAMLITEAEITGAASRCKDALGELASDAIERSASLERVTSAILGGGRGATYLEMYKAAAGVPNAHGVWARIVSGLEEGVSAEPIGVALHAAKAGAMMLPELSIQGLSKKLGPVSGDIEKVAKSLFDAASVFRNLPVLGGLNLIDLFNGDPQTPFPGFTTKHDGDGVVMSFDCAWSREHLKDASFGIIKLKAPKTVTLHVETRAGRAGVSAPTAKAFIEDAALEFANVVEIRFESVTAISDKDGFRLQPKFDPKKGIRLLGDLDFVEAFAEKARALVGGVGPRLQTLAGAVKASLDIALPELGGGPFAVLNAVFSAALELPFESRPAGFELSFGTREKPFLVAVSLLGGGGFFTLGLRAGGGPPDISFGIEFGGIFNFSVVVAKGMLYALGGIYAEYRGGRASITAYVRFGGTVDVLGLISASINALVSLTFGNGELSGLVRVNVDIHIVFVTIHASFEIKRTIKLDRSRAVRALSDAHRAREARIIDSYWEAFAE